MLPATVLNAIRSKSQFSVLKYSDYFFKMPGGLEIPFDHRWKVILFWARGLSYAKIAQKLK